MWGSVYLPKTDRHLQKPQMDGTLEHIARHIEAINSHTTLPAMLFPFILWSIESLLYITHHLYKKHVYWYDSHREYLMVLPTKRDVTKTKGGRVGNNQNTWTKLWMRDALSEKSAIVTRRSQISWYVPLPRMQFSKLTTSCLCSLQSMTINAIIP